MTNDGILSGIATSSPGPSRRRGDLSGLERDGDGTPERSESGGFLVFDSPEMARRHASISRTAGSLSVPAEQDSDESESPSEGTSHVHGEAVSRYYVGCPCDGPDDELKPGDQDVQCRAD